jgi:pimeloyl-ACP methyl ester carboxylesterase
MVMRYFIIFLFLFFSGSIVAGAANVSYDRDLSGDAYPFKVLYYKFRDQQQDLRMAYMRLQPHDPREFKGKTVVLLHGKNFNGVYWSKTAKALLSQGYQIIIPDQIGFGKSSKPEHYQFTFQALARNTQGLLGSLGVDKIFLVGHSMGGMLAVRYALMFPDSVEKLVLIDPIGLEDWKRVVPYQSVDDWFKKELKQTPQSIKEYERKDYYHGQWKNEYNIWLKPLVGWLNGPDRVLMAWDAALTDDMICTQPVYYELGDLKMPVLLIAGSRDRTAMGKDFVAENVRRRLGLYEILAPQAARRILKSRLLILKGVGHVPQIEDFNKVIQPLEKFLAD